MSIPEKCTVLVVGGGPSGSYTAAALARENIDTVLLEADVFPRYHIGESMLLSMRHFLRFIDLDETFNKHGFRRKKGASFKLNASKPAAFTDFSLAGGKDSYAWNVIRSESDHLMFKHAGKSGAQIFDGVKVDSVDFEPSDGTVCSVSPDIPVLGRPVFASWSRKSDGSSGTIRFDYLVDATGRFGLVSTKYMKNRRYNQGLKNIANWGYFEGVDTYAPGSVQEGQPFFEALTDATGWAWIIPLHNGTTSVGVVMNQQEANRKKSEMETPSTQGFYLDSLMNNTIQVKELLANAKLVSDVKAASDWSYSASGYASDNIRIVGDAGCFIDPFFSSGVHLALASALSAAVTISASIRGDCDEQAAMTWHSKKVAEGYTRFLVVALSALKQIRKQEEAVLNDFDEESFDRAFSLFRPIIQGTVDVNGKLTQSEVSDTVDFCMRAFEFVKPEDRDKVMNRLEKLGVDTTNEGLMLKGLSSIEVEKNLSPSELRIVRTIQARRLMRVEDQVSLSNFSVDIIDGLAPRLVHGMLGLMPGDQVKWPSDMAKNNTGDVMDRFMKEDVFGDGGAKPPDAIQA